MIANSSSSWMENIGLQGLTTNLGKVLDPERQDNCGNYAFFKAFKILQTNLNRKNSQKLLVTRKQQKQRERIWPTMVEMIQIILYATMMIPLHQTSFNSDLILDCHSKFKSITFPFTKLSN